MIGNSLAVDVPFAADCIQYYGELADKRSDEIAPVGPKDVALVRREPLGVVAAIVPWNYPLIISAWKLGPALVAGNSVVLKPAEQSSLTAIRLAALAAEAGLPDGVFNVVPGFGETVGRPLALHGDVDMVSFTGSTEVGKLMMRYAGESNMKRVALECGGKSPHVVMRRRRPRRRRVRHRLGHLLQSGRDLPRRLARDGASLGRDTLVEKIAAVQREQIPLGHPLDPGPKWGRWSTRGRCTACSDRSKRAARGRAGDAAAGALPRPAATMSSPPSSMMRRREAVSSRRRFRPRARGDALRYEEEAVHIANGTVYGLAAAVWTENMHAAHRLSGAIRAGTVWVKASTNPRWRRRSADSSNPASAGTVATCDRQVY